MLKRICIIAAMAVSSGWATMISTAPGYGTATHTNASWQRLGLSNTVNDGVTWSTDNGVTFGNGEIEVGEDVIFSFDMYKDRWGTHHYDALKVWIDMGKDNVFNTTDVILENKWAFNQGQGYNDNATPNNGQTDLYWSKQSETFLSGPVTFSNEGDFWLRARVMCSADLSGIWYGNVNNPNTLPADDVLFAKFNPTGKIGHGQGEVEDWKLSVKRVPEPGTIGLLGMALFALAFYRKRK